MLNSINTNIAAYSAQGNIGKASNSASSSISRLSSGNRIVKASDDVAALSIGTSLKTGVTTLKQALANASQGTSLLQVADGALSQVSDILQRQKAIATQANSGTLSDVERSYLNQEFQSLKSQIDQIASSTAFSSVKLLDGSLAGAAKVTTSATEVALKVATTPTTVVTLEAGFDAGDVITINGVDITTVASGATGPQINAAAFNSDESVEASAQATSLATVLNSQTDVRLAKFYWTASGANVQAQVRSGYELGNQSDATITYEMKTEGNASYVRTAQRLLSVADEFQATGTADTFTFNGVAFTVSTTSGASLVQVGTDAADQATKLLAALTTSTNPALTQYTFSLTNGTDLQIALTGAATDFSFGYAATLNAGSDVTNTTTALSFTSTAPDDDMTTDTGTVSLMQYDRSNLLTISGGAMANGDKVTINGVTVEFTSATLGTSAAVGKVQVGADAAGSAANLAAFLNSSSDARLSNFYFDDNGAGVVRGYLATGDVGGTTGLSVTVAEVTDAGNRLAVAGASVAIADTNSANGLGENRTRALGAIGGTVLANGGATAATAGSAINLSGIRNNGDFTGKLGEDFGSFTATYTAQDTITLSIKVGDVTYSSAATDVSNTGVTTLTLNGSDANGDAAGGSFSISLRGGAVATASLNGQSDADALAVYINESFNDVSFAQTRDITSFSTGNSVSVGGVEVARLDNMTIDLRSTDFSNLSIQSFSIAAPTTNGGDAVFSAVINGETYTSFSGIGSTFDNNRAIQLQSATNPNNVLTIVTSNNDIATSSSVSMDVSNQANADAIASAIRTGLGLDEAGEALSFQIGTTATDTIGVKIASVYTDELYAGSDLDVTTIAGAQAASGVIDAAIASINSVRAAVGALQSRLDFTSANLQSSIQNQDAARGTLLDTDVAAESTAYATAQVQLQAGIAVLAQANQLPQNLLKLIS